MLRGLGLEGIFRAESQLLHNYSSKGLAQTDGEKSPLLSEQ